MSTKLSISAASRKVRKGRETLRKMMNAGKLSFEVNADGNKVIDASELQRVFPDRFQMDDSEEGVRKPRSKTRPASKPTTSSDQQPLLDELMEAARREREQAEARVARVEKDFDDAKTSYQRSLRLIEDLTSKADEIKAEKEAMEERHRQETAAAVKDAALAAVKAWQEEERKRRQELAARKLEEQQTKRSQSFLKRVLGGA
ncbi:MAG: hypothetical protein Aurels2KO_54030 [Aureliella sp.]